MGRPRCFLDVEVIAFVVGNSGCIGSSFFTLYGKSIQKSQFLVIAEMPLVVEKSK